MLKCGSSWPLLLTHEVMKTGSFPEAVFGAQLQGGSGNLLLLLELQWQLLKWLFPREPVLSGFVSPLRNTAQNLLHQLF